MAQRENDGAGLMSESENTQLKQDRYSFEDLLDRQGYFVYTNVGTSMLPLLRQRRDLIEIRKKQGRCKKNDVVLYKAGKKYILHRIVKVREHDYVILGDHCIWREYGITDDRILGIMTHIVRNGKDIYPTDLKYRLYVFIWCHTYHVRAAFLYCRMYAHAAVRKIMKLLGITKESRKES